MVLSQSLGYLWLRAIRPGFSNFSRETFQITRTKVSAKLEIDIDILSIFDLLVRPEFNSPVILL